MAHRLVVDVVVGLIIDGANEYVDDGSDLE